MSTFRAFQTGLAAGQEQAKYRREDDARMKAADAFGKGNYEGAVSSLMGVGLMQDADAYERAGQRKQETERTQAYAKAFTTGLGAGPAPSKKTAQPAAMSPDAGMAPPQTGLGQGPMPQPQQPNMRGGYEALRGAAAQQGDFQMMAQVEQALSGMDEQQRAGFKESLEFLGQTALSLKDLLPEDRGQAAMEILQNSPYANPQILARIQQAAADGRITDEELNRFAKQTMSVADQIKLADANKPKPPEPFTLSPGQTRFGADGEVIARVQDRSPAPGSLTPYQQWQVDRGMAQDQREQSDRDTAKRNAMFSLEEGIDLVGQLLGNKEFDVLYGIQGAIPKLPGSPAADGEALLEQIGGQAFLAGVQSMRGTGPLSDREGKAVTAARTRLLNRGQSPGAARQAAAEFTASMQRLLNAYQQETGTQMQRSAQPAREYTPEQVQQAQMALANWDRLPANVKTPQMKTLAEQIVASASGAPALAQSQPMQLPPGVTQEMWDVMDDEDRAAFQ